MSADALARIHAMVNLDAAGERELDARLDAYRAEVLAENGDAMAERDCLAMAVRFALQWTEGAPVGLREGVNQILATMPATGEKATASATTATPGPTGRVKLLLDAIRAARGTWTTSKAFEVYRLLPAHAGMPLGQIRTIARGDLRDLAAWGHLTVTETTGRREYHLKTRKDGRS